MTRLGPAARIAAVVAIVVAVRLAAASHTAAQETPEPNVALPRVELGGGLGFVWYLPTASALVSVPAGSWLAVEGSASALPGHRLAQVQVRVPFASRWRSRRSLVVGLTRVGGDGDLLRPGLGAHVGASFQGALARRLDVRADLQQMVPVGGGSGADLRASMAFVWHRNPRAKPRRSWR